MQLRQFLSSFTHVRVSRRYPEGWVMLDPKIRLSSPMLRKHITGTDTYGAVLGGLDKKFLCLDFDYQKEQGQENYDKLVKYVLSLFQCPKVLLTSSQSGNRHCYLFFKKVNPYVARDRVINVLLKEGIQPRPGFVEVISSTNLRLPFGRGSTILNPHTLEPINTDKTEQINTFIKALDSKLLPSIYEATPSFRFIKRTNYNSSDDYFSDLQSLIKKGLPGEGTRNDCCLNYAIYLAKQGHDEEDIYKTLSQFMEENGHASKDYRANPEKVKAQLRKLAEWVINRESFQEGNSRIQLDPWCCELINEMFFKFNYSTQKAVFNLFKFIKINFINGRTVLPISRSFKYDVIGLNSRNYNQVFHELEEYELLVKKVSGDSFSKKTSLYKWIGPKFCKEDLGYSNFFDFLCEKGYIKRYSYYMKKVIQEEREKNAL
jgi:hypothetical protein